MDNALAPGSKAPCAHSLRCSHGSWCSGASVLQRSLSVLEIRLLVLDGSLIGSVVCCARSPVSECALRSAPCLALCSGVPVYLSGTRLFGLLPDVPLVFIVLVGGVPVSTFHFSVTVVNKRASFEKNEMWKCCEGVRVFFRGARLLTSEKNTLTPEQTKFLNVCLLRCCRSSSGTASKPYRSKYIGVWFRCERLYSGRPDVHLGQLLPFDLLCNVSARWVSGSRAR